MTSRILRSREEHGLADTTVEHNGCTYLVRRKVIAEGVAIEVWEPTSMLDHEHAVLTLDGGRWWGQMGSRHAEDERACRPLFLALVALVYPRVEGTFIGGFLLL